MSVVRDSNFVDTIEKFNFIKLERNPSIIDMGDQSYTDRKRPLVLSIQLIVDTSIAFLSPLLARSSAVPECRNAAELYDRHQQSVFSFNHGTSGDWLLTYRFTLDSTLRIIFAQCFTTCSIRISKPASQ